ncbi:MAG: hypothetical protein LAP38_25975 [Acidobacteriia bacterium]|nr:hypothetical protein [Terriglobia bacterium]
MTHLMERTHRDNKRTLDLSLLGSLFAMPAGASSGLMFGLMTGRSWEKSLVLTVAGAVLMGGVIFVMLYLHMLGRED